MILLVIIGILFAYFLYRLMSKPSSNSGGGNKNPDKSCKYEKGECDPSNFDKTTCTEKNQVLKMSQTSTVKKIQGGNTCPPTKTITSDCQYACKAEDIQNPSPPMPTCTYGEWTPNCKSLSENTKNEACKNNAGKDVTIKVTQTKQSSTEGCESQTQSKQCTVTCPGPAELSPNADLVIPLKNPPKSLPLYVSAENKKLLKEYFTGLYPRGRWYEQNAKKMRNLYLSLDCWYTNLIEPYDKHIIYAQQNWLIDIQPELAEKHLDKLKLPWQILFDGSVCDCIRGSNPNCVFVSNRTSKNSLNICLDQWEGLVVGKTNQSILNQAYNTNNQSNNFIPDFFSKQTPSKGKGFPHYAWIEGLSYPGEFGHPETCFYQSDKRKLGWYNRDQQGGEYKTKDGSYQPIKMPHYAAPWFNDECVKIEGSKKKECSDHRKVCVNTRYTFTPSEFSDPDRNYNIKTTTQRCVISKYVPDHQVVGEEKSKKSKMIQSQSGHSELNSKGRSRGDPNKNWRNWRGLWLYPLRGVGMWFNLGKTYVANTKLGYLLTSRTKAYPGGDYSWDQILDVVDKEGGFARFNPYSIKQQIRRVKEIIMNGKVDQKTKSSKKHPKRVVYVAMTIQDLKKHGYRGGIIYDDQRAENASRNLIEMWYKEGYTGMLPVKANNGKPWAENGFNYLPAKYFPIGSHFSYSAALDKILFGSIVKGGFDTLQLVLEPQFAAQARRAAYMFETYSKTPSKRGLKSIFTSTRSNVCQDIKVLSPMISLDHYIKFGYLTNQHLKRAGYRTHGSHSGRPIPSLGSVGRDFKFTAWKVSFNPNAKPMRDTKAIMENNYDDRIIMHEQQDRYDDFVRKFMLLD